MSLISEAINASISRRKFLKGLGVSLAAAPLLSGLTGCSSAESSPRPAASYRTRLVLLGTMGGVSWWPASTRASSSSALVVGNSIYLIDVGQNATYRLAQAFNSDSIVNPDGTYSGAGSATFLQNLKALFLTHIHQDHTSDYPALLLIGPGAGLAVNPANPKGAPIPLQVFGPCNRGQREANKTGYTGTIICTDSVNPALITDTPGTRQMTETILQAFAQTNNDMTLDNGYRDFTTLVNVTEIGGTAAGDIPFAFAIPDPNSNTCPVMAPFLIYGPDTNGVSAWTTLVNHHQVFPAFAFRFYTPDGSVVFSGDTGADTSGNLQKLANGADILVHEVIDPAWIEYKFGPNPIPPMDSLKTHMQQSHTPIDKVGAVARDCNVKTLVINHIVPGMTPMSHLLQAQQNFSGKLIIGEDLMEIGLG